MKDEQDRRIEAIVGGEHVDFLQARKRLYGYLKVSLQLPCEVTGIEEFRWEEPYLEWPADLEKYIQLMETQPSGRETYELLEIDDEAESEWVAFGDEDIGVIARRRSDGREFCLGLASLVVTDRQSPNYQVLWDYATWWGNR